MFFSLASQGYYTLIIAFLFNVSFKIDENFTLWFLCLPIDKSKVRNEEKPRKIREYLKLFLGAMPSGDKAWDHEESQDGINVGE